MHFSVYLLICLVIIRKHFNNLFLMLSKLISRFPSNRLSSNIGKMNFSSAYDQVEKFQFIFRYLIYFIHSYFKTFPFQLMKDGIVVIKDFCSPDEVARMHEAGKKMCYEAPKNDRTIFSSAANSSHVWIILTFLYIKYLLINFYHRLQLITFWILVIKFIISLNPGQLEKIWNFWCLQKSR